MAPELDETGDRASVDTGKSELGADEQDMEVIRILSEVASSNVSFKGLRRALGIHQETLSRLLHRLEREGYIDRTYDGYKLSPKGLMIYDAGGRRLRDAAVTILQTYLPGDIDYHVIASTLKSRWFGSLRWFGHSQDRDELVLTWMTEDGKILLDVTFKGSSVTVEARIQAGESMSDAVRAAHEILSQISKAYRQSGGRNQIIGTNS